VEAGKDLELLFLGHISIDMEHNQHAAARGLLPLWRRRLPALSLSPTQILNGSLHPLRLDSRLRRLLQTKALKIRNNTAAKRPPSMKPIAARPSLAFVASLLSRPWEVGSVSSAVVDVGCAM
jgi:hypothetical protein